MWPPTRGSNTVSAIGAPSRLCSGGLKSPNRSVNTVEGPLDRRVDDDLAADDRIIGLGHDFSSVRLFDDVLVTGQRSIPEGVELVPQRRDRRPG